LDRGDRDPNAQSAYVEIGELFQIAPPITFKHLGAVKIAIIQATDVEKPFADYCAQHPVSPGQ
jgi:hypothetical protein